MRTNQSRKTDINIIMASSPLHHANPTRRPIPSVDIPHCLRVSYNSGVTHYRDTNIVILWLQHDDEEDRKIPRRRHRHSDNTTVTPEHSRWRHTPRRSLTRSSRQVLKGGCTDWMTHPATTLISLCNKKPTKKSGKARSVTHNCWVWRDALEKCRLILLRSSV